MNQIAIYHEKIIINQMRENLPYCQLERQQKQKIKNKFIYAKHELYKDCKDSHINFYVFYGCVEKVY